MPMSEFHEQTEVQQLAEFIARADIQDISPEALWQLKIRVLDTLGVAIGALEAEPIIAIKGLLEDLGGTPQSTMIGGGKTSPERAAFYNSALSRYLDFMDSYLAKGETKDRKSTRLNSSHVAISYAVFCL